MGEYKTKNEHPKGARTPQRFKGYRGLKDRRVGRFFKRTNTRGCRKICGRLEEDLGLVFGVIKFFYKSATKSNS